jgi:type IV pilus assembly protein PilX
MKSQIIRPSMRRSKGFALFAVMMLLLALMVISMTFLRTSSLNERMVGNDLDRNRAYQIAEATIRDAQRDILQVKADGTTCVGSNPCRLDTAFGDPDSGGTDLAVGCSAGICHFTPAQYKDPAFLGPWEKTSPFYTSFAKYGDWSGATWTDLNSQFGTNVAISQQPRYWIELLPVPLGGKGYRYRITVQAWGVNANTVVTLQEIYYPGI